MLEISRKLVSPSLQERREFHSLTEVAATLARISEARVTEGKLSEKLCVAQAFCLYISDSIRAVLTLYETPFVSQAGAIARAGMEGCISGAYLLISPSTVRDRYVAYSNFSVARNIERYFEDKPQSRADADQSVADLILQGNRAAETFGFSARTFSGINESIHEQVKHLDRHCLTEGLPAEWQVVFRLGFVPANAHAHASAASTLMAAELMNAVGRRSMGFERGQYMKGLRIATYLFERVMLRLLPETRDLLGIRKGYSWTRTDGLRNTRGV